MEGVVWAEEGAKLLACFFCLGAQKSVTYFVDIGDLGQSESDTCCHPSGVSFTR